MTCFVTLLLISSGVYAYFPRALQPATRVLHGDPVAGSSFSVASQITPAPKISQQELRARANFNTCGYVSGNPASPLTCPSSYDCSSTIGVFPAWACCNQVKCQGNYVTCVDYGGLDICTSLGDECSSIYTSILYCSSDAPSCFKYARSTTIGDKNVFYSIGCGKSSDDVPALAKPTNGDGQKGATDDSSSDPEAQSTFQPSSNSSPNSNSDNNNSNNKTDSRPSDAITAIVVPVVTMVVAVIVAWWRRHQFVWLLTCGARGYRHSKRPDRIPQNTHPYASSQSVLMSNFNSWPMYNPIPQANEIYAPGPHQGWPGRGYR